jgi:hypothetical protein
MLKLLPPPEVEPQFSEVELWPLKRMGTVGTVVSELTRVAVPLVTVQLVDRGEPDQVPVTVSVAVVPVAVNVMAPVFVLATLLQVRLKL